MPPGDPDFGRRTDCECQRPRIELERHGRLVRYSNLANLTRSTFDTLDPHVRAADPESRELFVMARDAAQRFAESAEGWLLISGPNGSGKTHLAAAIANRVIERGRPALFVHVPDLLDHLRAAFSPQAEILLRRPVRAGAQRPVAGAGRARQPQRHALGRGETAPDNQPPLHRRSATVVTTTAREHELDPYLRARLTDPRLSVTIRTQRDTHEWLRQWGEIEPEMLRRMTFGTFDVRGNESSHHQSQLLAGAWSRPDTTPRVPKVG